jgi:hypothetical protein
MIIAATFHLNQTMILIVKSIMIGDLKYYLDDYEEITKSKL